MCGRYVITLTWSELVELYGITVGIEAAPNLPPRYNVAPTQTVPVVRQAGGGGREAAVLRWGLVPAWAQDPAVGSRMINARAETVAEKPSFRAAFKARRCIVPASGYYEWRAGAGKGAKQPHYFQPADGSAWAFAGLWERWTKGDAPLDTFTIVTCPSNEKAAAIHHRMPVVLAPDVWDAWLDPATSTDTAKTLLQPLPDDEMHVRPVDRRVNSVRNDDAGLIEPSLIEQQRRLL